jgi:GGDEF domain-containing protein
LETGGELGTSQFSLLITSIDWYAGIRHKCGVAVARSLASAAARTIKRHVGESAVSAYFGDGRFATLLAAQSAAAVKSIAETVANEFGCRDSLHESIPRPTLTSAVLPWSPGMEAEHFLNNALETLELAEHSGGACVVVHGEYDKELTVWREETSTGNPFVNVVAQDIMAPFPAFLDQDSVDGDLVESLRRGGVPVRPYVNRDGNLVGVDAIDDDVHTRFGQAVGVSGANLAVPETIPFDASFPEIYEAFSSRGCATLVVTSGSQPLGYISCDGFLSMIDPIDTGSFAHAGRSVEELAFLAVPSKCGDAAEPEAVGA